MCKYVESLLSQNAVKACTHQAHWLLVILIWTVLFKLYTGNMLRFSSVNGMLDLKSQDEAKSTSQKLQ